MTYNEAQQYIYNAQDQLTEVKKGSQTVASYSYDLAGNQISKTEDGKTTNYTYDQANQLEKLQSGNTVLGEYSYDAQGQRLTKKVGATTTKYYYDSLDLLYTKENDTLTEVNVLADDGDIVLGLRGSKEYRYIKDVRGSVTNILDSAGAVVLSYTYDAYGNTSTSNQSFKNSFAYTGAVIDTESGLYYMNARYYDPATGRFISQDSYRGDGERFWHLYVYCNSDPVNNIDKDGKMGITVIVSSVLFKVLVTIGLAALALMTMATFNKSWNRAVANAGRDFSNWMKGVTVSATYIRVKVEEITWKVMQSFANTRGKSKYGKNKEYHHMVAKGATKAIAAQKVLSNCGIGVNSHHNMIWLKYGLHKRIHNNLYYAFVNNITVDAYNTGRDKQTKRKYVYKTLDSIRRFLKGLDNISPF